MARMTQKKKIYICVAMLVRKSTAGDRSIDVLALRVLAHVGQGTEQHEVQRPVRASVWAACAFSFLLAPSLFFIWKTLVFIERCVGEWCRTSCQASYFELNMKKGVSITSCMCGLRTCARTTRVSLSRHMWSSWYELRALSRIDQDNTTW